MFEEPTPPPPMHPLDPLPAGSLLAFRYELSDRIALGETAEIYEAREVGTGEGMVVKLVRPAVVPADGGRLAMRLAEQADILRRIHHPGLVRLVADGWDDRLGARFLALEVLRGETLKARLQETGSFPLDEALRVTEALCEVLEVMHRHRFLHLELGPGSIFLPADPTAFPVKLTNLGLHHVEERSEVPERLTVLPGYLAPERLRGEPCDERSDVYSVGAVFHRMLAGAVPVRGDTPQGALDELLRHPVPGVPASTPGAEECDRFVRRCMEISVERRPRDAAEALGELRRVRAAAARQGS